jgi:RNase P subunit RPR2
MVKIIGTDENHIKRVSCKKCASKLEYVQSEVKSFTHYDYGGGSDECYYITCPKCDNNVYVKGY